MTETIAAFGDGNAAGMYVWTPHLLRLFDKTELKAISTTVYGRDDMLDEWREAPKAGKRAEVSTYARVESATGYPPAFASDVLTATRCDVERFGTILGGEVTYGADGRPRQVGLIQAGKSKQCLEATRALLASSLVPLGVPTRDRPSLLLLPDRSGFVQCMDESSRRRGLPPQPIVRAGEAGKRDRIQEPKKVRDRAPRYPESARLRRAQGIVILEAQVEPSGCIAQVALVRGVDTSLDVEAIRAVSGWVYAPTLLNGERVPVTMTVTVNFKLSP